MVFALVFGGFTLVVTDEVLAQGDPILTVATQDEPKTRNILAARDVWTHNVLDPVYDSVTKTDPETDELKPYILKGTDANGDGAFQDSEYGVFTNILAQPLEVTAFYDFNYVYFHDGYQATVEDLLFTYHLDALDPRTIALDVLKDKNNLPGSNYSQSRWLHLWKAKIFTVDTDWQISKDYSDPSYNTSLRAAIHFRQQAAYWDFYRSTLSWRILPAYLWEGTGCIYDSVAQSFDCNIHKNKDGSPMDPFGVAYDRLTGNGLPANDPNAFDYGLAESWDLPDEHVIGTGPFTFDRWIPGQISSLDRNDEYYVGESYLHKPYIERMYFLVFKTTQTVVSALRSGDIDYIAWSIPPAFLPELLNDPNVGIFSTPPKGFAFLTYNMRHMPFGYPGGDPANGDVGKNFRQAIAHLIDKKTIVTSLLQNHGIVGDGPVSPVLAEWYNSSIQQFQYDSVAADALLDTYDAWDPSDGPCLSSGLGCRNFPGIGTSGIEVITPNSDYDPIRAASGSLISQMMRSVGINVNPIPVAHGELDQKIDARDFQMAILNYRTCVEPPEYLHSCFYSRNSAQGENYPGYQSDEFDTISLMTRGELDRPTQVSLVKQAQGILADDRPYDVLYFRTNIEVYRSDRFVNWTVGPCGSIYSYWSWLGIHEPPPDRLRVSTSIQTDVVSGSTAKFTATVTDPNGIALSGAIAHVYVNPLDGEFVLDAQMSNLVSGVTDSNGELEVTYFPPALAPNDSKRNVFIFAWATHLGYNESKNVTDSIVVHPPGESALSLVVELPEGDIVSEGSWVPIGIQVIDTDGSPVSGANVNISSVPPATINPSSGVTDATGFINGSQNVAFMAPEVSDDTLYLITVTANKTGYDNVTEDLLLTVKDNRRPDVDITSISSGDTLSGVVIVSGIASDPDGFYQLVKVEVKVDGGDWETAVGTATWSYSLDTTCLSEDTHTIYARSYDGKAFSIVTSVTVMVDNNAPPSVAVISVDPGQTLSGEVNITGNASDSDGNDEIVSVQVRVDGGDWQNATGTTSWSFLLDTEDLDEGNHILQLRAFDGIEISTLEELPFVVENEVISDCPDGECGGMTSILGWLSLIILVIVVSIAAFFLLVKRMRRPKSEESLEERVSEETPTPAPEEEHKD